MSKMVTEETLQGLEIKFPKAPDGTVTYNKTTGEVVKHADAATAFAAATGDVEVVTERVDMFGAEFFLEEVTQDNPYVYPNGMIQSQATEMNGVTTSLTNRPATYYAVFDGDTTSSGKGVNFFMATPVEQKALVADPSNNLYLLDSGKLVQWRMRQRTIAGSGNGDWGNVNSSGLGNLSVITFQERTSYGYLQAQGVRDTFIEFGKDTAIYYGTNHASNTNPNNGIFKAGLGDALVPEVAVDGECYFHVWGVVPRLNQGAYHPSFNALGAAQCSDSKPWYSSTDTPTTELECFTKRSGGSIGSTSGRDDGKFYDAVYTDGQGGVVDYRLSAWDMDSKEEASKVTQKVISEAYQGLESYQGVSVPGQFTYTYTTSATGSVKLPRKCLSPTVECIVGSTRTTPIVNSTTNTVTLPNGSKTVTFTAFAKQTKPSVNKVVLNGSEGIGDVLVTNSYGISQGVLLNESVTGKIGTGSDFRMYKPLDYIMDKGMVSDINTSMTTLPTNASEIQTWQIENSGQVSLMFFDGTSYHELAIPYGYSRKQARAGGDSSGHPTQTLPFVMGYYGAIAPPSA